METGEYFTERERERERERLSFSHFESGERKVTMATRPSVYKQNQPTTITINHWAWFTPTF